MWVNYSENFIRVFFLIVSCSPIRSALNSVYKFFTSVAMSFLDIPLQFRIRPII
jgi:hypothetical protein